MTHYLQLLKTIKERRIELGIKSQDMAARLGVSGSTYSMWELNNIRMPLDKYLVINRILKLDGLIPMKTKRQTIAVHRKLVAARKMLNQLYAEENNTGVTTDSD